MAKAAGPTAHQLKCVLAGSSPSIWRRIVVPSDITLGQLHDALQVTFDWENAHLHEFSTTRARMRVRYGLQDFDDYDPQLTNEDEVILAEVVPVRRSKLRYDYDFGDSWRVEILVEKVLPRDKVDACPACVAGERAAPPEDCGGIWSYEDKIEILADPDDEQYEEIRGWFGETFDPARFDIDSLNTELRSLGAHWEKVAKKRKKKPNRAPQSRPDDGILSIQDSAERLAAIARLVFQSEDTKAQPSSSAPKSPSRAPARRTRP